MPIMFSPNFIRCLPRFPLHQPFLLTVVKSQSKEKHSLQTMDIRFGLPNAKYNLRKVDDGQLQRSLQCSWGKAHWTVSCSVRRGFTQCQDAFPIDLVSVITYTRAFLVYQILLCREVCSHRYIMATALLVNEAAKKSVKSPVETKEAAGIMNDCQRKSSIKCSTPPSWNL